MNLTAIRKPAVERRPVVRNVVQRSAGAAAPTPARALQNRVGNRAVQAVVAPSIQTAAIAARVSKPTDAAEMEAEAIARHVARMSQPAPAAASTARQTSKSESTVQREAAAPPRTAAAQVSGTGGSPLSPAVRDFMEPRFGANFQHVRMHTGTDAAHQSAQLGANAFTYGNNVFFGKDKFQPQTAKGKELIAHELTHTIQQGAASQKNVVHRSAIVSASEAPMVQRDFLADVAGSLAAAIPNPRKYFANKAENIPGFTMLTVVIGYNPITNARVARTAGNILKGAIQMIPGGKFISDALESHGIFDQVSQWVNQQFEALKDIGAAIWQSIEDFIKGFKLSDLTDLGGLWERAKALVTTPIERIKNFAIGVKNGIVKLIKDAILKPIAAFAATTRGYPLLRTIMGKDPITGETVAQDAESLLGAFLKFIGEDELWATMQKAKAVPRAFAWFKAAKAALMGFIAEIPGLFVAAFKSLEVMDIILIPRAFVKLAHVFGGFAGRFISWGAKAVWNLLEIIFDVVSPKALIYIKKTGSALKSILRNPLPFVGNLVKAAKQGFLDFGANILSHLKRGLIDWLTGSLEGVYIPTALTLPEFGKFALSVLGLSWAQIRAKIVKALGPSGEMIMKGLEGAFDIVKALVTGGPAAAWEVIKDKLTNLKDTIVDAIQNFVIETIVTKAVPKLIALFIPGAGFISAIVSIYDTIKVFIEKISKIAQVVTAFIDSIVEIASGNIASAAKKVESILGGLLSLAISFLAGFLGLGKVTTKIKEVVNKVRDTVDKALDTAINFIIDKAKKLFGKLFAKNAKDGDPEKEKLVNAGLAAIDAADQAAMKDGALTREAADKVATTVKQQHPVFKAITVIESKDTIDYDYIASPGRKKKGGPKGGTVGPLGITRKQLSFTADTKRKLIQQFKAAFPPGQLGQWKTAKLDIRHKVSISDTIKHLNDAISPLTIAAAAKAMEDKGSKAATKDKPGIIAACREHLQKANNDLANLFVGAAGKNRRIKQRYDPGDAPGASATAPKHDPQKGKFIGEYGFEGTDFKITIDITEDGIQTETWEITV